VMSREFQVLRAADEAGAPSVLHTYGATNPAEFFAVATEAFFERPLALSSKRPELYRELMRFYQQDPRNYSREKTELQAS
jgi:Mlc titration factor MtfA (ptsG expression regulator)